MLQRAQGSRDGTYLAVAFSLFSLKRLIGCVQVSQQAIDATVGALAPSVDVGRLFRGVAPGGPHALRCIICYRGHHYCALVLSEELQRWLLFNDANVRSRGLVV